MKTLIVSIVLLASAALASAQVYDGRGNITASGGVPVSGRPAVVYPRVEPPPAGRIPNNPAPFYITPMANNGIIRNSEGGYAVPLQGGGYVFYGPGWGRR